MIPIYLYSFPDWFSNIVNSIISGIITLFSEISNAVIDGLNYLLLGILNAFGQPFLYWDSIVSQNGLFIPVIFISILLFTAILIVFYLNAAGLEEDIYTAAEGLVKL